MKDKMATRNGNQLQQAIAVLIQSQATLMQNQAAFVAQLNEVSRHQVESDRRFARIEDELEQIKAILLRHDRVLAELPESAVLGNSTAAGNKPHEICILCSQS
ncbi:MAG: hypothetical protein HY315_07965 [Acidobacteria bacterium]|nr:hypothetical protein [Acidobacteriota bacterium]